MARSAASAARRASDSYIAIYAWSAGSRRLMRASRVSTTSTGDRARVSNARDSSATPAQTGSRVFMTRDYEPGRRGVKRAARALDRARGDIDRQREEGGVEDEGHDAVGGDGAADLLAGDGDVGDLGRHADDEGEVDEVPVVGLRAAAREGHAAADVLVVELVGVVQREDGVDERPRQQDRGGRQRDVQRL